MTRSDAEQATRAPAAFPVTGGPGHRRLTPRNLKAAETRERILVAAAAAFDVRGYMGVNLKDVVEELGLTSGALYYFFKSKEVLAAEIIERHYATCLSLTDEVLATHANRLDSLVALTYRVGEAFEDNIIVRAGERLSAERNLIKAELHPPLVEWRDRITKLIKAGQRNDEISRNISAPTTADVIISFFLGAQEMDRRRSERQGLKRRLDRFWALTLSALQP